MMERLYSGLSGVAQWPPLPVRERRGEQARPAGEAQQRSSVRQRLSVCPALTALPEKEVRQAWQGELRRAAETLEWEQRAH